MKTRRTSPFLPCRWPAAYALLSFACITCKAKSAERTVKPDSAIAAISEPHVIDSAAIVRAAIAVVRAPARDSFRVIRFERTDSGVVVDLVPDLGKPAVGGGGRVLVPPSGTPRLLLPYR